MAKISLRVLTDQVDGDAAEAVLQRLDAEDVVEMSVREQDGFGCEAFLREQPRERFQVGGAVAARVHDDAAAGFAPGHVGALLEEIATEGTDIEHFFASFAWQIYKTCVKFVCYTYCEAMHIGIAGNIGSGKTTLTRKLAEHYGWTPKYEAVTYNPYLVCNFFPFLF